MVSDPGTRITHFILQAPRHISDDDLRAFAAFTPASVAVVFLVDSEERAKRIGDTIRKRDSRGRRVRNRLNFVARPELAAITQWTRDAFTVLYNPDRRRFALLAPVAEAGGVAPWRDFLIDDVLVSTSASRFQLRTERIEVPPTWVLDGGSVTADDRFVYLGSAVLRANQKDATGTDRLTREDAIRMLEAYTGKTILPLPVPELHSDRFHLPLGRTAAGERTSLLADPVAALKILAAMPELERKTAEASLRRQVAQWMEARSNAGESDDLYGLMGRGGIEAFERLLTPTPELIRRVAESQFVEGLRAAEDTLRASGITVVRIPTLPRRIVEKFTEGKPSFLYFPMGVYYVNAVQDARDGKQRILIPTYGIDPLDRSAIDILTKLGFGVSTVNGVTDGLQGGGPRCRVQILGIPEDGR